MGVRVCRDVVFFLLFLVRFCRNLHFNCGIAVKIFSKFSECSSDSIDYQMGVTVFHAYVWDI